MINTLKGLKFITVLVLLVFTFSSNIHIYAMSAEQKEAYKRVKPTNYFDKETVCAVDTSSDTSGAIPGANNAEKIWNFLSDPAKGLKDYQVAGIMGNMAHESGLEPQRMQGVLDKKVPAEEWTNRNGGGWGLVQWTPGSKMINPTKDADKDPNDLTVQLEFLWEQLQGKGPVPENTQILEQIKGTPDMEEAVKAFQGTTGVGGKYIGYERPGDQAGSVPDRLAKARLIYNKLKGTGGSVISGSGGASVTAGCTSSSTAGSASLSGKVKEFAWPDYHKEQYIERMPGWAKVADDPKTHYVGGSVKGVRGIDCGGFVTTLMRESGYDPDYNPGKGATGSPGDPNSQWGYLEKNWEKITVNSTSDLRPGDVAINGQHTFLYVGEIEGFNDVFASASFSSDGSGGRAPMAGQGDALTGGYNWYRKK